jgi:hypothetical protein
VCVVFTVVVFVPTYDVQLLFFLNDTAVVPTLIKKIQSSQYNTSTGSLCFKLEYRALLSITVPDRSIYQHGSTEWEKVSTETTMAHSSKT